MSNWDVHLGARERGRGPYVLAGSILAATLLLLLARNHPMPPVEMVRPLWTVLIISFNLMTLSVLVAQYRSGAGPRVLALSWAVLFSAITAAVMFLVLPGFITAPLGPLEPSYEATVWAWALRHLGLPVLVVVSLVPWSDELTAHLGRGAFRSWRTFSSHAIVLAVSALLVWLVVVQPIGLPSSSRVSATGQLLPAHWLVGTTLSVNFVGLVVGVAAVLYRREVAGLEIWAVAALVADFGDCLLTSLTSEPATVAWYGARALGLVGAVLVLAALLREVTQLHTSTRAYAEQVRAQNSSLVEAQGLRDHLVAVVSHEMRSPLAGLQGYLELLLEDEEISRRDAHRMHQRSRLLVRRLIMLTEDLLASASTNGQQVIPEVLTVRRQVEDCVAAFPELSVLVHCPADLEVMADPLRLQQILANLVRNAQKYGAEPVQIHATRIGGSTVQVCVSDAGPGVDPAFVPHLFDRYSRGSTGAQHGSGLGLSVARSLAERHGGTLDYDPATNAFAVRLPAVRHRAGLPRPRRHAPVTADSA